MLIYSKLAHSVVRPQVIGRSAELARVCQILSRRKKNNPLLLGEPGVGKTAVAEGLAYIIAKRITVSGAPLPPHLQACPHLHLNDLKHTCARYPAHCSDFPVAGVAASARWPKYSSLGARIWQIFRATGSIVWHAGRQGVVPGYLAAAGGCERTWGAGVAPEEAHLGDLLLPHPHHPLHRRAPHCSGHGYAFRVC